MRKKLFLATLCIVLCGCGTQSSTSESVSSAVNKETVISESSIVESESIIVESESDNVELGSAISKEIEDSFNDIQQTLDDFMESVEENYGPEEVTKSLDSLCKYMESSGAVSGNKIAMAASMGGAESGVKYESGVEIYEYDVNSDSYAFLIENGYIVLEGFNIQIKLDAINSGYAILIHEGNDNDFIINTFNSFFE